MPRESTGDGDRKSRGEGNSNGRGAGGLVTEMVGRMGGSLAVMPLVVARVGVFESSSSALRTIGIGTSAPLLLLDPRSSTPKPTFADT